VDVRTPDEFKTVRIAGAVNLPLDRLDPAALRDRIGADATVYCVCQTGTRSQLAAATLRSAGFTHVVHVDGGTNAWAIAGLPVLRGAETRA
jgi:rhodanese-related sulfurtransferase